MSDELISQVKKARRASVPLIGISTPDQFATCRLIAKSFNGNTIVLRWDCLRGLVQLAGEEIRIVDNDNEPVNLSELVDPAMMLDFLRQLPEKVIVFALNAHKFWESADVIQGIANLRDEFKQNFRHLIMLAPMINLPAELTTDVVVFDEQLPDQDQVGDIIRRLCVDTAHATMDKRQSNDESIEIPDDEDELLTAAGCPLNGDRLPRAVSATQGLPAFSIEQIAAMSLFPGEGLDMENLWELKRQQIEQTQGLSVYRDGMTFDDVGGLEAAKTKMTRFFNGPQRPEAIFLLDEIEKAMAGTEGDNTGVSQDFTGTILTYMERHKIFGVLFVGLPGTGKSAIAESAGTTFGVPTIACDLGSMKQKELGESEANIRMALKVTTAMSNGNPLFVATANSVRGLNSALRDRFIYTYYFDLPSEEERSVIFDIWMSKLGVKGDYTAFEHKGWSGRNIQRCCLAAHVEGCTIDDAAEDIIPAKTTATRELDELREEAHGRYLSAAYRGTYQKPLKRAEDTEMKRPVSAFEE